MPKCKELSRLPKAPNGKYVNFRRQTPGCTADQFKLGSTPRLDYLDPSHPATTVPKNLFPNIRSDILGVKAVPFAVLTKPEHIWTTPSRSPIDTWTERVKRLLETNASLEKGEEPLEVAPIILNNAKEDAIPMSFINATSKKRTSNKKHIRGKIALRLKIAINLIVARGADVVQVNGRPKLVMNETEADKWVSPGWTYIFFPTLEIYRMPYYNLIPLLRESLQRIYDISQKFERKWAASATIPRKASPTRYSHYTHVQTPRQHAGKTTPANPLQQRTPRQTAYRAYSTRSNSTAYSGSVQGDLKAKTSPQRDSDVSKKHKEPSEVSKMPREPLSQSRRSKKIPAVGNEYTPKIVWEFGEDDPRIIEVLEELRDEATRRGLGASNRRRILRMKLRCISNQETRHEKLPDLSDLEFIGLNEQPNPSYDPFPDVEPGSKPGGGPTPTREAFRKTGSARMLPPHIPESLEPGGGPTPTREAFRKTGSARMLPPHIPESRAPAEAADPAFSDYPFSTKSSSTPGASTKAQKSAQSKSSASRKAGKEKGKPSA